jgi:hypothetical protein
MVCLFALLGAFAMTHAVDAIDHVYRLGNAPAQL